MGDAQTLAQNYILFSSLCAVEERKKSRRTSPDGDVDDARDGVWIFEFVQPRISRSA